MRRVALTAILCLVIAPLLPAREGGKDPAHGLNFYSIEREIALGKQLSAELERQVKLCDDAILSEYVNRVTQNIARQTEIALPVTIRIIESGDLNAFTLPGGHVYVTSAMLKLTESEAELAFVLAHELGHVAARHATREASRDRLIQLGTLPLTMLGGWSGFAARELAQPVSKLGLLKGERDFEAAADRLGVDYLDAAGYDPEAAIEVFERIEGADRRHSGKLAQLYGTHPITPARIEHTQKHLNEIAGRREAYIINTSEYEEMRLRAVSIEARRITSEQPGPSLLRATEQPRNSTPPG
jgi:predicted Zn-dependent protease